MKERLTDQERVILILAKMARCETITQEEHDAIDPRSPEPGIEYQENQTLDVHNMGTQSS